jgi:large subunit ribosomal protein L21
MILRSGLIAGSLGSAKLDIPRTIMIETESRMYAIIRDRGRQYTVREGDTIDIDLLSPKEEPEAINFDDVLLVSNDDGVKIGRPSLDNAKVSATLVKAIVQGPKIIVMKFRRRKDSQVKTGHRQRYTRIKIDKIEVGAGG